MTALGRTTSLIGERLPRVQDDRMLRGKGRYVDDLSEVGVLHAAIIRSPLAHGVIRQFDASAASTLPGVVVVLGPDDIGGSVASVPLSWLLAGQQIREWAIVERVVRYVGQPVGIVVAVSRAVAEDAVDLVEVDYEHRAAVVGVLDAQSSSASLLYPELGTNRVGSVHFGSPPDELDAIFSGAPHVVQRDLVVPRISHSPLEPRGLVAEWIPTTDRLEIVSSTQVPHLIRQEIAHVLRLRVDQVHVTAVDVGGSFGQRVALFPDEAMVCLAAKLLGRKVKWIEDRFEALTACYQGRGTFSRSRLALDDNGRFLAIQAEIQGDVGAFCASGSGGTGPFQVAGLMLEGPYRFERAGATVNAWYTNAPPTTAFRGYGMQEGTWIRERLVDEAARLLGRDPVELRLLNMLKPGDLPHDTHTGVHYDNGDYPAGLTRAAEIGAMRAPTSNGSVRRGIGLASMVEITGFAPTALLEQFEIHWSGWDSSSIRVNEDGTVTVFAGVTSSGQGIETALTQIAAERLHIPADWVQVQLGDTATAGYSNMGNQASRSLALAGGALWRGADKLRERMINLAAAFLSTTADKIVHDGAKFVSEDGGTISWAEVAHRGWMGWGRGASDVIRLEETVDFDPPGITFGYATHGAQVAVDLGTGTVKVERYWIVHDSGVIVNPMIADGQMYGGVAMGIGAALHEQCTFDENGQPTATTYLDYILPVSEDIPDITIEHLCTPSHLIPGGFKGLGESGTIPPPAVIGNAVAAAVPEIADKLTCTPLTPDRVWGLLAEAGLTTT